MRRRAWQRLGSEMWRKRKEGERNGAELRAEEGEEVGAEIEELRG